jgi:Cu(I)/Ag(I) efflux system membrane fusion protein
VKRLAIAVAAVLGVVLLAASFHLGRISAPAGSAAPLGAAGAPDSERKVLYWHDPMVPGPRFDKPGKSPFMDMQLVPVYADAEPAAAGVAISPGCSRTWASAWRRCAALRSPRRSMPSARSSSTSA